MHSKLELPGVAISYQDRGAGPVILLLHGFPATADLWADVVPALVESGFRTITPDLVGYGQSTADPGISIDMKSQARWMLSLLDSVGAQSGIVIAHDVGSAAAQLMLALAPQQVRGLAIVDGAHEQEWAMQSIESIVKWDPSDAHRIFPVLTRRLAKSPRMRQMLTAYEGVRGGRSLIRAARDLKPEQTAGFAEVLRAARKPALVIWGESDRFLPLDTVARPLADALSAPLVVVPGGHFSPIDCPAEVCTALRPFLQPFLDSP